MDSKEQQESGPAPEPSAWSRAPSEARLERAVSLASEMTGVSVADIRGLSRAPVVTAARWMAWGLIWGEGFNCSAIAWAWGCDHTSIMNARDKGWGMEKAAPDDGDGPVYIGAWG